MCEVKQKYLTEAEACKALRVSRVTLWRWRKNGTLPYSRIGGTVRIPRAAITAAIKKTR